MKRKEAELTPLAQRLRALRAASGMTQEELADHLGIKRATYAYYETGATRPPLKTLQRIAAEYLVTVEFLLDTEPAPASRLPLRQDDAFEGANRMRECDKQERAFLSMLRRMGDEEKEKLYFYCLDLLEKDAALADMLRGEDT